MLTLTTWPRRRDDNKSASLALFDISGRVENEMMLLRVSVFFYIGDLLNGRAMSCEYYVFVQCFLKCLLTCTENVFNK